MAKKKPVEMGGLDQIIDRLNKFMEINNLVLPNVDKETQDRLHAQNSAFYAAQVLVKQVKEKGHIWVGGYVDGVGVLYEDQLTRTIEEMKQNKDLGKE